MTNLEIARLFKQFKNVVKNYNGLLPQKIWNQWNNKFDTIPISKKYKKGGVWEGPNWEIVHNNIFTDDSGLCKHSKYYVKFQYDIGIVYPGEDVRHINECVFLTPRIAVAYNEGGCASTGLCIDCILDKVVNK